MQHKIEQNNLIVLPSTIYSQESDSVFVLK